MMTMRDNDKAEGSYVWPTLEVMIWIRRRISMALQRIYKRLEQGSRIKSVVRYLS